MDDLSDKIARLLSSPEGMEKIRTVMSSLGSDAPAAIPAAASVPAATAAPAAPTVTPAPPASAGGSGAPDPALLGRVMPLLGALNSENDDTRLLQALRPYLHGEREQRLDETMRLLRLTRLLPLLQDDGASGRGREG